MSAYSQPARAYDLRPSPRRSGTVAGPAAGPADRAGLRRCRVAGLALEPTAATACKMGPWGGRRAGTVDAVVGGLDWRRGSQAADAAAATRCAPRSPKRSDRVSDAGFAIAGGLNPRR